MIPGDKAPKVVRAPKQEVVTRFESTVPAVKTKEELVHPDKLVEIREKIHDTIVLNYINKSLLIGDIFNDDIPSTEMSIEVEQYWRSLVESCLPEDLKDNEDLIQQLIVTERDSFKKRLESGVTMEDMEREFNDKHFKPEDVTLAVTMQVLGNSNIEFISEEAMEKYIHDLVYKKVPDPLSNRNAAIWMIQAKVTEYLGNLDELRNKVNEAGNPVYSEVLKNVADLESAIEKVRVRTREQDKTNIFADENTPEAQVVKFPVKIQEKKSKPRSKYDVEIRHLQNTIKKLKQQYAKTPDWRWIKKIGVSREIEKNRAIMLELQNDQ